MPTFIWAFDFIDEHLALAFPSDSEVGGCGMKSTSKEQESGWEAHEEPTLSLAA